MIEREILDAASANRQSNDPLGNAPPTPSFIHSETEHEGTNRTPLPEYLFPGEYDWTDFSLNVPQWDTFPLRFFSELPGSREWCSPVPAIPIAQIWSIAGPSTLPTAEAGNEEMTRPSMGSPPVETTKVGSKRKRTATREKQGKVRAAHKKLPRLGQPGPTQVSVVQFVPTQIWPVTTVALDDVYYPTQTPRSPHGGADNVSTRNPGTPAKSEAGPTAPTERKIHVDDPCALLQTSVDTRKFAPNHPRQRTYQTPRYSPNIFLNIVRVYFRGSSRPSPLRESTDQRRPEQPSYQRLDDIQSPPVCYRIAPNPASPVT